MTTRTATATKPRPRKVDEPATAPPVTSAIAETAVQLVQYRFLQRAPENVRYTREHEDVMELADDIAGHGLLQSLIGYQTEDVGQTWTWIVGGGRRLAALALLHTRGLVGDDYRVPVLVRGQEEAIELSLAENLARRNMSPVDEFLAFRHLRANGADEAELAKRFGFSERYVRQRLRLANLHSTVLTALSERQITIDAAMAYRTGRSIFTSRVFDPDEVKRVLKSGHNSRKIGKVVTKGHWRGMPIFTLTLEERATCPRACPAWAYCYGNNMQAAERISAGPALEDALRAEVADLQARHPGGFVVRLHVLGDFYSAAYAELWGELLDHHPALRVFGFTARAGDAIGAALVAVGRRHRRRFAMRVSGLDAPAGGALTIAAGERTRHITCPAQLGLTDCCATCALCWHSDRTIAFLRH